MPATAAGLLVGAIVLLVAGGPGAALVRSRRTAVALFLASALPGCALAVTASVHALRCGGASELWAPWPVPGGALRIGLDPLGAWFALVVGVVGAPVALYAPSYLCRARDRAFGAFACLFDLLLASLLLLAAARNALLFLAAWELTTVAAYLLVVHRHEDAAVRRAGRLYLLANHVAAFGLLAVIAFLADRAGSLDFDAMSAARDATSRGAGGAAGVLLVLALVACGTKAGAMPLHIWLPHAHPAAPSPVSAVLSGVVIKAGIFGLLRFLPLLPPLPAWAGVAVLALGAVSGVLGVLYALAQHDLKRLLAYHSVENIGIILLGTGVGLVGAHAGHPLVAALGFAGALLHLLNHALFKALLFLGAGSVIHAAGTGEIDRLGGVAKRMPVTAALFLVGCVSICALPPFNGFASEWTVYRALFGETLAGGGAARIWSAGAILVLALIGGLAAACFAKAFSAVFLGEPRSARDATRDATHDDDAPVPQRAAMAFLAAACLAVGLVPWVALELAWPAAAALARGLGDIASLREPPAAAETAGWLGSVALVGGVLVGLVVALAVLRRGLGRAGAADAAPRVPTWGYARPNPRMQHTASSFAAPLVAIFRGLLRPHEEVVAAQGTFARPPSVHTTTPDAAEMRVFRPAHALLVRASLRLRALLRGPVQLQVSFVMAVLALLLLWKVAL